MFGINKKAKARPVSVSTPSSGDAADKKANTSAKKAIPDLILKVNSRNKMVAM